MSVIPSSASSPTVASSSTVATFVSAGKTVRVERFDPAPGSVKNAAVVLLHGADGVHRGSSTYREAARCLTERGFLALLLHYFDSSGEGVSGWNDIPLHFTIWMRTVRDAVTFAREQLRGEEAPVGVVGFSLGAYLALSEAAEDERVRAVVDCFGGFPDLFVPALKRMPPVLILHGTSDPIVPVAEAHKLEKLLADRKLPFEKHLYAGVGHGFQGPVLHDACQRAASFLERHLRERGPAPA